MTGSVRGPRSRPGLEKDMIGAVETIWRLTKGEEKWRRSFTSGLRQPQEHLAAGVWGDAHSEMDWPSWRWPTTITTSFQIRRSEHSATTVGLENGKDFYVWVKTLGVTDSQFFSVLVWTIPSHCFSRISWGDRERKIVGRLFTVSQFLSRRTQIISNIWFLLWSFGLLSTQKTRENKAALNDDVTSGKGSIFFAWMWKRHVFFRKRTRRAGLYCYLVVCHFELVDVTARSDFTPLPFHLLCRSIRPRALNLQTFHVTVYDVFGVWCGYFRNTEWMFQKTLARGSIALLHEIKATF